MDDNALDLLLAGVKDTQQRKEITAACAKTYAADGNCYAPGLPQITLDLNVASSDDPSHGR